MADNPKIRIEGDDTDLKKLRQSLNDFKKDIKVLELDFRKGKITLDEYNKGVADVETKMATLNLEARQTIDVQATLYQSQQRVAVGFKSLAKDLDDVKKGMVNFYKEQKLQDRVINDTKNSVSALTGVFGGFLGNNKVVTDSLNSSINAMQSTEFALKGIGIAASNSTGFVRGFGTALTTASGPLSLAVLGFTAIYEIFHKINEEAKKAKQEAVMDFFSSAFKGVEDPKALQYKLDVLKKVGDDLKKQLEDRRKAPDVFMSSSGKTEFSQVRAAFTEEQKKELLFLESAIEKNEELVKLATEALEKAKIKNELEQRYNNKLSLGEKVEDAPETTISEAKKIKEEAFKLSTIEEEINKQLLENVELQRLRFETGEQNLEVTLVYLNAIKEALDDEKARLQIALVMKNLQESESRKNKFEEKKETRKEEADMFQQSFTSGINAVGNAIDTEIKQKFQEAFGEANSLLEKFVQAFLGSLAEMAAKAIAANIFSSIFGGGKGEEKSSGSDFGAIGSIIGGVLGVATGGASLPFTSLLSGAIDTGMPKQQIPNLANIVANSSASSSLNKLQVIVTGEISNDVIYLSNLAGSTKNERGNL